MWGAPSGLNVRPSGQLKTMTEVPFSTQDGDGGGLELFQGGDGGRRWGLLLNSLGFVFLGENMKTNLPWVSGGLS